MTEELIGLLIGAVCASPFLLLFAILIKVSRWLSH